MIVVRLWRNWDIRIFHSKNDMDLEVFKAKLKVIEQQGFIISKRKSTTGIGYTLETLLDIDENNIKLPDLGEIELKSKRKNVSTFVTLFTFNSGIWQMPQSEVIKQYGYEDKQKRRALKCFVTKTPNNQGLYLNVTEEALHLMHTNGNLIAAWPATILLAYFARKLPSLILVLADVLLNQEGRETFHYNEAYLLTTPSKKNLITLILEGYILVDIRMHLKENGSSVRNRGTAFRINEKNLIYCFENRERLL